MAAMKKSRPCLRGHDPKHRDERYRCTQCRRESDAMRRARRTGRPFKVPGWTHDSVTRMDILRMRLLDLDAQLWRCATSWERADVRAEVSQVQAELRRLERDNASAPGH